MESAASRAGSIFERGLGTATSFPAAGAMMHTALQPLADVAKRDTCYTTMPAISDVVEAGVFKCSYLRADDGVV